MDNEQTKEEVPTTVGAQEWRDQLLECFWDRFDFVRPLYRADREAISSAVNIAFAYFVEREKLVEIPGPTLSLLGKSLAEYVVGLHLLRDSTGSGAMVPLGTMPLVLTDLMTSLTAPYCRLTSDVVLRALYKLHDVCEVHR